MSAIEAEINHIENCAVTPSNPDLNSGDILDRTSEFIWGHDFNNPNVSTIIGNLGIRAYGELADMTREQLLEAGILKDEMSVVVVALAKRNMTLKVSECPSQAEIFFEIDYQG